MRVPHEGAGFVDEPSRKTRVADTVDVVVAGGGVAGMGAAYAAARNGANTLLIERNSFLGGTATAGIIPMVGGYAHMRGFAREFFGCLGQEDGSINAEVTAFDVEPFKQVALVMLSEAGVRFLFYTVVAGTVVEDGRVKGVIVEGKSGREAVLAHTVIDTTGDADVATSAGAPFTKGREFDGRMRPVSIAFYVGGVDLRKVRQYMDANRDDFSPTDHRYILDFDRKIIKADGFFQLIEKAKENGDLDDSLHYLRLLGTFPERGVVLINTTRIYDVDGTDAFDLTRGEIEARMQMQRVFNFARKYVPGFENAWMIGSSTNIGVRETRHIVGRHVVSDDDIDGGRTYDDVVCRLSAAVPRGMASHSPDGGEAAWPDPWYRKAVTTPSRPFELPYRALLPQKVEGILVAGRCLSVTHSVDNHTRGMTTCMETGQVAGTAAALAARQGVVASQVDIGLLQETLANQGLDLPRVAAVPRQ